MEYQTEIHTKVEYNNLINLLKSNDYRWNSPKGMRWHDQIGYIVFNTGNRLIQVGYKGQIILSETIPKDKITTVLGKAKD